LSPEKDEKAIEGAPIAPHFRRHGWIYVVFALPVSLFALFLLPLALYRANWALRDGVLEVTSPALAWFLGGAWFRALSGGSGFAAATIGHIVIARDARGMDACRAHEHAHVRQCERWGPLFPLAYIGAGLWAAAKKRRWSAYYHDNPFEIEARAAESNRRIDP
jgi:hypothetical protein